MSCFSLLFQQTLGISVEELKSIALRKGVKRWTHQLVAEVKTALEAQGIIPNPAERETL